MSLQLRLAFTGNLKQYAESARADLARGARTAVTRIITRGKLMLREDTRRGGLGDRAANTWRGEVYPQSGTQTLHPAGLLFSKWPVVMQAFAEGATIRAKGGFWLAIPTDNVPIGRRESGVAGFRGRKKATPEDVEDMFNQDLIFKADKNRPGVMIAYINAIAAKNKRGFRAPTKGRLKQGRKTQLVAMFVMVRQARLKKRVDPQGVFNQLADAWPGIMGEEIASALGG